jgi:hypothetical protein
VPTDPNAAGPGGFTRGEWESIMADPAGTVPGSYVNLHPEVMQIDQVGDTTYYTVTPKVLPLVAPLHSIGLKPLADLIEPALRVIIEETGYDRSISPGTVTPFRLIPIFNPIKLATDLVPAVQQGVQDFVTDLTGGGASTPAQTFTAPPATTAASVPVVTKQDTEPVVSEDDVTKAADTEAATPAVTTTTPKTSKAKASKEAGDKIAKSVRDALKKPAKKDSSDAGAKDAA